MMLPASVGSNGSYGPDALAILHQAFDDAWAEIAGNFADDALTVQSARTKLAEALLRAAEQKGCSDSETLKAVALHAMALSYASSRSH